MNRQEKGSRLTNNELRHENARLLSLLRELYAAANPSIMDDADTGVRLPPEWKERILGEIENFDQ